MTSPATPSPKPVRPDRPAPGILWPLATVILTSVGAIAWLVLFSPGVSRPATLPETGVVVRR
jgi:hypothetical protein